MDKNLQKIPTPEEAMREWLEGNRIRVQMQQKVANGVISACDDIYRRVFEEGLYGRTIHDVIYERNLPGADKGPNADDDEKKQLEDIRQSTGNTVIYRRGTIRRVMRALQEGQGVAVLIDQHIMGRDAIYVDFFDRPAATIPNEFAKMRATARPEMILRREITPEEQDRQVREELKDAKNLPVPPGTFKPR